MLNFFFPETHKHQQKVSKSCKTKPFFEEYRQKIERIRKELDGIRAPMTQSYFLNVQSGLQQEIRNNLQALALLENILIPIFFIGPVSSGKSTFINSLIGQKALPSRNQMCTNNLIIIVHDDTLDIDRAQLYLRDEITQLIAERPTENGSTDQIYNKIQEKYNQGHQVLYIKVNSYFHRQLPQDLREKVYFIDTPGLNFQTQTDSHILELFDSFETFIQDQKQLRPVIPLQMWFVNYQTADIDQDSQRRTLDLLYPEEEAQKAIQQKGSSQLLFDSNGFAQLSRQTSSQSYQQQSNQLQRQQIINKIFVILNKYDQRKPSEDTNIQNIINMIQSCFPGLDTTSQLFKASGLWTYEYRILNSECQAAIDRFVTQFQKDYALQYCLKNKDDVVKFLNTNIKSNLDRRDCFDYPRLEQSLIQRVKDIINDQFYHSQEGYGNILLCMTLLKGQQEKTQLELNEDQINNFVNRLQYREQNFLDVTHQIFNIFRDQFENLVTSALENKQLYDINEIYSILQNLIANSFKIFDEYDNQLQQLYKDSYVDFQEKLQKYFPMSVHKSQDFEDFFIIGGENLVVNFCQRIFFHHQTSTEKRMKFQINDELSNSLQALGMSFRQRKRGLLFSGLLFTELMSCNLHQPFLNPVSFFFAAGLIISEIKEIISKEDLINDQIKDRILTWKNAFITQMESFKQDYEKSFCTAIWEIQKFFEQIRG